MASERAFWWTAALLFALSTTATFLWCDSMASMSSMAMPGGWTMSMAWMRMPGQSWVDAGAAFLGMWTVMMVAMMLPSLLPMLRRYRAAVRDPAGMGRLTILVAAGYYFVWAVLGAVIFPVAALLAALQMQIPALARAVPILGGVIILIAGMLQFTAWKARRLACCRQAPRLAQPWRADASAAWRHGLRLGLQCVYCCAGLTATLLVIGVMELRVMALVTAAITLERLAPRGERIAQITGAVILAAGSWLILQAVGF